MMRAWSEAFMQALPANWRALDEDQLEAVVKLMTTRGPSLAWAPRSEVIRAVLAAPDDCARARVLEANGDLIVEDVEAVLDSVRAIELQPAADDCRDAIAARRANHPKPAQSYAATVLTGIVHGPLGMQRFREVRMRFAGTEPLHDVEIRELPYAAVGRALARAFADFQHAGEDFNRNKTQHMPGAHFSDANLLGVLLLIAGLLGELQRSVAEDHEAALPA